MEWLQIFRSWASKNPGGCTMLLSKIKFSGLQYSTLLNSHRSLAASIHATPQSTLGKPSEPLVLLEISIALETNLMGSEI